MSELNIEIPNEKSRFNKYQGFRWSAIGNSGSGKTQVLRYFLKKLIKTKYIVYDIEGEYIDCGELVKNIEELEKAITDKKTCIVFSTEQETHDGMKAETAYISSLMRNNEYFVKWSLFIDESHLIFDKSSTNTNDDVNASNIALWTQGRKRGINIIQASQQVSLLNLSTIRQSQIIFVLAGMSENEKKRYFSGYEHIGKLDDLQEYYILNLTTGEIYPPVELV